MNMLEVLQAIREQPRYVEQLTHTLGVDCATVMDHLKVLEHNKLLVVEGQKCVRVYFLSTVMEGKWSKLEDSVKDSECRTSVGEQK